MTKYLIPITILIMLVIGRIAMSEPTAGNDFHVGPDGEEMELIDGELNVNDIETSDDVIVGDDLTVTDDVVISGDLTVSGESTITVIAVADISVTTPTVVGQLMFDTATTDLYVATATVDVNSWQKVGVQD